MNINLLTAKTGQQAEEAIELKINDFWRTYIILLATRKGQVLFNEKQVELLVYLLTHDTDVSHFEGQLRKDLCEYLNISSSELTKLSKDLITENLLIQPEKAKRGKWFLVNSLLSFRKFILLRKEATFLFPIKIDNHVKQND